MPHRERNAEADDRAEGEIAAVRIVSLVVRL